ncbi:MAG: response regulator [Euryarchaeota archaeon]|nr:response regulator [Euryarchaeota archaeon]
MKIMVVDDEPDMVYILRIILEKEGHSVVEAYTGKECLQKLKSEKIDIILLDDIMPGMDGWRTCKLIKENEKTSSIPVCMLTVLSREVERRTSLDLALADAHLGKPFEKRELVETVRRLLRNPRERK